MSLRREFLVHKGKTVESFGFVKSDISSLNTKTEDLKNGISSVELKISMLNNEISGLGRLIEKNSLELSASHSNNLNLQSKIGHITSSIESTITTLNSLNKGITDVLSRQKAMSRSISSHARSIKRLFASSKAKSLKHRRLNSALVKAQKEIIKIKNSIKKIRKKRTIKIKNKIRSIRKKEASITKNKIRKKEAAMAKNNIRRIRKKEVVTIQDMVKK